MPGSALTWASCQCGSPSSIPVRIRRPGNASRHRATHSRYAAVSRAGGFHRSSGPTCPALTGRISPCSSGSITQRVKSACSVKAIEGKPRPTARAQDCSIDPATASQDHSVCTCPSGGSTSTTLRCSPRQVRGVVPQHVYHAGMAISLPDDVRALSGAPNSGKLPIASLPCLGVLAAWAAAAPRAGRLAAPAAGRLSRHRAAGRQWGRGRPVCRSCPAGGAGAPGRAGRAWRLHRHAGTAPGAPSANAERGLLNPGQSRQSPRCPVSPCRAGARSSVRRTGPARWPADGGVADRGWVPRQPGCARCPRRRRRCRASGAHSRPAADGGRGVRHGGHPQRAAAACRRTGGNGGGQRARARARQPPPSAGCPG